MTFLDLLAFSGYTVYRLSKESGVPLSTLHDIASGRSELSECKGKTLLALSSKLNVTIEELLDLEKEEASGVLPQPLVEAIDLYRLHTRKGTTFAAEYCEMLRSTINVCEIENLVSTSTAQRIRNRYFEL